jgi:hypothetical protein
MPAREPHDGAGPQPIERDESPVCGAEYPLVSEGKRSLLCVAARVYRHPGLKDRPWKAELEFLDGDYRVFGYLHLGFGEKPHAGRTSRYWAAWCLANNGQPPRKRQLMSARIFKGKWFTVIVETVRQRGRGEKVELIPAELQYSVVREILARGP